MMWRRVVKAMGIGPRRGVAAVALMTALLSGPAMTLAPMTLAQDATPELHPFVPEKTPEKAPEKAPEPRQEAPATPPAAATASSSAAASSAAPKRIKPKVPRPATPALPGQTPPAVSPATSQPAPAAVRPNRQPVPAPMQPQPQQVRPVTPAPVAPAPQPGLPATFPTVNGAPPPAVTVTTNPSLVTAQPVTPRNPATPISADDIETYTDSVVRTLMQRDHVMGVTVAVVQGNTPILVKGYGYDRLSPTRRVDPNNSLFRLGSISKVFTWIVARQEIEAGRIKLDAPIAQYVPNDIFSDARPFKPLTLHHLMDHTGGFEDTSLGHLFVLNPSRIPGTDSYLRHRQPHRQRDPGQFSSYSNFGPELAARALTQTAQAKDVPSLMEARVFQPLGMDHTSLREPYRVANPEVDGLPQPLSNVLTQDLSDGRDHDVL